LQHPNIIDESLKKEIEAGCILGPFDNPLYPTFGAQAWVLYQNIIHSFGSSAVKIVEVVTL